MSDFRFEISSCFQQKRQTVYDIRYESSDNPTQALPKSYRDLAKFQQQLLKVCNGNCRYIDLQYIANKFPRQLCKVKYEAAVEHHRREMEKYLNDLYEFVSQIETGHCTMHCTIYGSLMAFTTMTDWERMKSIETLSLFEWRDNVKHHNMTITSRKHAHSILHAKLPGLTIPVVEISSSVLVVEDIREQLLQFNQLDIAELNEPNLTQDRKWQLALYIACCIGNLHAVQILIAQGVPSDASLRDGTTALNISARMGHYNVMEYLINAGANVNLPSTAGITPLIAACRNGWYTIVELLIQHQADIHNHSHRGTHPIHAAVVAGSIEIVRLLLESGADANAVTMNGTAPIHFATKLGNYSMCNLLLDFRAEMNIRTANNNTPLTIATSNNHREIIQLLLTRSYSSKYRTHAPSIDRSSSKLEARISFGSQEYLQSSTSFSLQPPSLTHSTTRSSIIE